MKEVETVEEHCPHKDCVYRCRLNTYGVDYCNYILFEKEPRRCNISECDKYKKGSKTVTMTGVGIWFDWRISETRDDDDVY